MGASHCRPQRAGQTLECHASELAGASDATDTIVRPDALGATTLLQLRSSEAPTSFSWEVGLGPNQRLEKLSGGDYERSATPHGAGLYGRNKN